MEQDETAKSDNIKDKVRRYGKSAVNTILEIGKALFDSDFDISVKSKNDITTRIKKDTTSFNVGLDRPESKTDIGYRDKEFHFKIE